MSRSSTPELLNPFPEPEQEFQKRRRCSRRNRAANLNMAALPPLLLRTISYFAQPDINGTQTSIIRPAVNATTFEIKPNIIQMVQNTVQFHGLPDEDPNRYIESFLEICDTFKINNVSNDTIRLRLFPFSLRDRAKL